MYPIIWSNVEISVGIICACLPILRPVVQAAGRRIFGESSTATRHSPQFPQTADEIYGFEQSLKVPSPNVTRRVEGYLVMSEMGLPTLPAAADLRRESQRAGCRSPKEGQWGSRHGENNLMMETKRVKEYEADVTV